MTSESQKRPVGFVWERDAAKIMKESSRTLHNWLYIKSHAKAAAKDRYGINITNIVYRDLCRRILKEHKAVKVMDADKGREIWMCLGDEKWPSTFIVWDPIFRRILTFLKPEWVERKIRCQRSKNT